MNFSDDDEEEDHGEEVQAQPRPDRVDWSDDVQTGERVGGVVDVAQGFRPPNVMFYGGDNHRDLVVDSVQQSLNFCVYKVTHVPGYLLEGFIHQSIEYHV